MSAPIPFDVSVPVLLFKVSKYPLSHGTLGAVRSLGRLGVPVFALAESTFVPYAFSRYIASSIVVDPQSLGPRENLVAKLIAIQQGLGKRAILIATDDEAALLVAEHARELAPHFLFHNNDASLLAALTSKYGLYRICRRLGIPTPRAVFVRNSKQTARLAKKLTYPVVVKNSEPWTRLVSAAVGSTTIVASKDKLLARAATWPANSSVILQDYIPAIVAEDWIVHAYCDSDATPAIIFTGLKQRSWPPGTGVTTAAEALQNDTLRNCAARLLQGIRYRGIVDMDWRYDGRDGQYKLVDFNPRLGANFRLFSDLSGLDVIRALHLDLTGRGFPSAAPEFGRRFVVENLDLASRMVKQPYRREFPSQPRTKTEFAWFASDDLVPFFVMCVRFAGIVVNRLFARSASRLFKSQKLTSKTTAYKSSATGR